MKNATSEKPCPRTQLEAVPTSLCYIFGNVQALRDVVFELEAPLVRRALDAGPVGRPWAPGSYTQNILPAIDPRLTSARAALAVLENCAEFKEADILISPILAALAELEIAEQIARQDLADKQRAHADALALAQEKALQAAAKDPAVVAAAAALAAVA